MYPVSLTQQLTLEKKSLKHKICLLLLVPLRFKIHVRLKAVISYLLCAKIRWQSLRKGFFFCICRYRAYKSPFVKAEIVQICSTLIKIFNKTSLDILFHSTENKLASVDMPTVTP